jgi:hypothetical protein
MAKHFEFDSSRLPLELRKKEQTRIEKKATRFLRIVEVVLVLCVVGGVLVSVYWNLHLQNIVDNLLNLP